MKDFEPGDTDIVGRLNLSLFGTRDAVLNWTLECTGFLEKLWFQIASDVTMQFPSQTNGALLDSARRRFCDYLPDGGCELVTQRTGK